MDLGKYLKENSMNIETAFPMGDISVEIETMSHETDSFLLSVKGLDSRDVSREELEVVRDSIDDFLGTLDKEIK